MERVKSSLLVVLAVTAAILVLSAGAARSAVIRFQGPDTVLPADGIVTFGLYIDSLSLSDLDAWNIGIALSSGGAEFTGALSDATRPDYVFADNSFSFNSNVLSPTQFTAGGTALTRVPAGDVVGDLLVRFGVDVANTSLGETYTMSFYAPGGLSYLFDSAGNLEFLEGAGQFQVAPIPGAIWLLAAGIGGLIGLRRKGSPGS